MQLTHSYTHRHWKWARTSLSGVNGRVVEVRRCVTLQRALHADRCAFAKSGRPDYATFGSCTGGIGGLSTRCVRTRVEKKYGIDFDLCAISTVSTEVYSIPNTEKTVEFFFFFSPAVSKMLRCTVFPRYDYIMSSSKFLEWA